MCSHALLDRPTVEKFSQRFSGQALPVVSEREKSLCERLLTASNHSARILRNSESPRLREDLLNVINLLGTAWKTDRLFLWRYAQDTDERRYLSECYEWSPETGSRRNAAWLVDVPFRESENFWTKTLVSGECLCCLARLLPCTVRNYLNTHGIRSVLVAPILFQETLWGVLCLGACRWARPWKIVEIETLKSVGAQIGSALNHLGESVDVVTKIKNEFMARMGHEFKTPMNAILGMTHLCLKTELSELQKDYLRKTQLAATELLNTVNGILEYSQCTEGRIVLEEIPFRLFQVIEEVVAIVNLKAEEKGLNLAARIDRPFHDHLLGDPGRLRQVLLYLIDNAIKFTEEGEIRLMVQGGDEEDPRSESVRLMFSVSDTGIGLDCDRINTLFQAFSQGDGSSTRRYGGLGMGLAIAKKLVELMDGSIHVDSVPGIGSTFHFTALFRRNPMETSFRNNADGTGDFSEKPREKSLVAGARVLLVEDNKINQLVAGELLKELEIEFSVARNGWDAVAMVEREEFDLILMDIQMPVMDGLTATREIRKIQKPGVDRLPIIALTSNSLESDRISCLNVGMNDHLSKPIDPDRLRRALETWIMR